jgi:hypothetical protein
VQKLHCSASELSSSAVPINMQNLAKRQKNIHGMCRLMPCSFFYVLLNIDLDGYIMHMLFLFLRKNENSSVVAHAVKVSHGIYYKSL